MDFGTSIVRIIRGLGLMLCLSGMSPLWAKSSAYKGGLNHYTHGEFKEAAVLLQRALNAKPDRDEKISAHKYLGLSLFTLGRTAEAEQQFIKCLTLDRNCSIKKEEALDESVLPFFKQVKERLDNPSTTARSTPSPAAVAPAPSPSPVASPAPAAGTRIIVLSNVKEANVLVDGILAGPVGATLSSSSGAVEIEVEAKGFNPRKLKISVPKNALSTFKIDLQPEGPSKEELAALAGAKLAKEKAARLREKELAAKEKSRSEVSSRDHRLPRGRDEDVQADDKTPPVLPREDGIRSEAESDSLFSEEERRSERSSSIERESRGRRDRGTEDFDVSNIKADSPNAGKARIPISFFHLLPLGAGQIYNESYLLGGTIFAIHVYAAYSILEAQQNMQRAADNLTTAYKRNDNTPEQLTAYAAQIDAYTAEQQTAQTRAALIFGGSYLFGVVQAVLMRPEVSSKSSPLSWEWTPDFSTEGPRLRLVMDWHF